MYIYVGRYVYTTFMLRLFYARVIARPLFFKFRRNFICCFGRVVKMGVVFLCVELLENGRKYTYWCKN